ncbi:MAG TPA: DNA-3-methyladenine glycosylase I [Candidatus Saccharimonadia bacterium]|nr:DNA-3-methyladenine glycosylase I [Candidatus Saccharimonadia bacterium]
MAAPPVLSTGDVARCWWSGSIAADAAMVRYHDAEWGVQVRDDTELFERLTLEAFQAGLSWSTILHKRQAFAAAFRGFDPAVVAGFDAADVARLMDDAGIVRNRAKVMATIGNARAYLRLLERAPDGFGGYLDGFVPPPPPRRPLGSTAADLPTFTPVALALSKDLRSRGFSFVGPTIVYAFLQSVGWVDDHLPGCFRYRAP